MNQEINEQVKVSEVKQNSSFNKRFIVAVVIIGLFVIATVGVFVLVGKQDSERLNNVSGNELETNSEGAYLLADSYILSMFEEVLRGFSKGSSSQTVVDKGEYYEIEGTGGNTIYKPRIVRGDIDEDGDEDVVGIYRSCGGSCGSSIFIAINNNKEGEYLNPRVEGPSPFDDGRKALVSDVVIRDGIVTVLYVDIAGNESEIAYTLEGEALVALDMQSGSENIGQSKDEGVYFNELYDFQFTYPKEYYVSVTSEVSRTEKENGLLQRIQLSTNVNPKSEQGRKVYITVYSAVDAESIRDWISANNEFLLSRTIVEETDFIFSYIVADNCQNEIVTFKKFNDVIVEVSPPGSSVCISEQITGDVNYVASTLQIKK